MLNGQKDRKRAAKTPVLKLHIVFPNKNTNTIDNNSIIPTVKNKHSLYSNPVVNKDTALFIGNIGNLEYGYSNGKYPLLMMSPVIA